MKRIITTMSIVVLGLVSAVFASNDPLKKGIKVEECGDDLQANCTEIKPGEGRLLDCLHRNETKISSRCNQALKDGGWK